MDNAITKHPSLSLSKEQEDNPETRIKVVSDGSFNSVFQRAEVFILTKPGFSFLSYITPLALYLKSYHQTEYFISVFLLRYHP